jgi:hypothetical protein
MVGTGMAAHEGQLFGISNQLLGLFTVIGLLLLSASAVILWWRRRAVGVLGAASRPRFSGHWPLSSWHSGYLRDIFEQFLNAMDLDVEGCLAMKEAYEGFFGKAEKHLANVGDGLPTDIDSFRWLFSHPAAVVVSTCHVVKGEEYDTVSAFGLLRGYTCPTGTRSFGETTVSQQIWNRNYSTSSVHELSAGCTSSRSSADRRRRKKPYQTSYLLAAVEFEFDER